MERGVAAADVRSPQLTPFLTKLRSSAAARSTRAALEKQLVAGALVVERHAGEERKGRALDELVAVRAPLGDLHPGVRRPVEQAEAHGVADAPVVEVAAPSIHLLRGDARGVVHIRRQQPRFVPSAVPQRGGELVVMAKPFPQSLNVAHRHAERLVGVDAVARKAVQRLPGGTALEGRKRRLEAGRGCRGFFALHRVQ